MKSSKTRRADKSAERRMFGFTSVVLVAALLAPRPAETYDALPVAAITTGSIRTPHVVQLQDLQVKVSKLQLDTLTPAAFGDHD
jgi:hypothetical protein